MFANSMKQSGAASQHIGDVHLLIAGVYDANDVPIPILYQHEGSNVQESIVPISPASRRSEPSHQLVVSFDLSRRCHIVPQGLIA